MRADPVTLEVFNNLFSEIAEEMGKILVRSAVSTNIKERRDLSCAIFDRNGELIAQAAHIPVHLGSMPFAVKTALREYRFSKGDAVILNDPFLGGTHLPDITLVQPVFYKDDLVFFVANRAHYQDIGGISPGSMPLSTSVYQEGIIIPPIKIMEQDNIKKDVLKLIISNMRNPQEREADLLAQIGANRRGMERLVNIIEKHSLNKVLFYAEKLKEYARKAVLNLIDQLPKKVVEFEDFLDDDGLSPEPVRIHLKLTVREKELIFDFTKSSNTVTGPMNAPKSVTYSAVLYVIRCLLREHIPTNQGLLDPIRIVTRRGSILDARKPAAVAGGNVETSQRIVDVCLGALHKLLGGKIPAASQGTMNNVSFGDRSGRISYYETIAGGMGASEFKDGESAIHSHMTNTRNTPIEALEFYYPVRITQYKIRRNSGGKGKTTGGDGIIREYLFLEDMEVTVLSERRRFPPYGLEGGEPGKTGRNIIIKGETEIEMPSKFSTLIKKGERLRIETPGGGGYGTPKSSN